MHFFSFRKTCRRVHLVLGLLSGLVILIVALTGCLYAFQEEIKNGLYTFRFVEPEKSLFLSPETLKEKAIPHVYIVPSDSLHTIYGVTYFQRNRAATVAYNDYQKGYSLLYLNPYSGEYAGREFMEKDFFRFVLAGHRSLWLPTYIGKPIVGWSVLIFVFVLLSGVVIWFPKRIKKQSLLRGLKLIGKPGSFRFVYDLHKVLGAYIWVLALVIALTGLTWSFQWFANGYYSLLSGGKKLQGWEAPVANNNSANSIDQPSEQLWKKMCNTYPIGEKGSLMFDFPSTFSTYYRICYNPTDHQTYYKSHHRFFDSNTLQELAGGGIYGISYEKATLADKIYRMTYDLHTGAIGGIPGKTIAFLVSTIIASLPVTGILIFIKKKERKDNTKRKTSSN